MRWLGRNLNSLFAADRQPLAPLGAAPLQHQTAVLRAHADQKPVRAFAPAGVGLERTLSLHRFLRKSTRICNRSEGVPRVSNGMALCYSLPLPAIVANSFRAHARSVSHQS